MNTDNWRDNLVQLGSEYWKWGHTDESKLDIPTLLKIHNKISHICEKNMEGPLPKLFSTISVNGIPGSGKTTFISIIENHLKKLDYKYDYAISKEGVDLPAFKELLKDFYISRLKNDKQQVQLEKNYNLQLFIVLYFEFTYISTYFYFAGHSESSRNNLLIKDVSFDSDKVFRNVTMPKNSKQYALIETMVARIKENLRIFGLKRDDVYFFMTTSIAQCEINISKRSRIEEKDGLTRRYLTQLSMEYERLLGELKYDPSNYTKTVIEVEYISSFLYTFKGFKLFLKNFF